MSQPFIQPVLGPNADVLLTLEHRLRGFLAYPYVIGKMAEEGVKIPVLGTTGWKQREETLNTDPGGANRVLIMPGWGPIDSRSHGVLAMPRQVSSGNASRYNPQAMALWRRKFTLSVWSVDNEDTADEKRQIVASTNMVELVVCGLLSTVGADLRLDLGGDIHQDRFSANATYGIELLVPMVVDSLLFAVPRDRYTAAVPVVNKDPSQ